jgi:hypothetical protein
LWLKGVTMITSYRDERDDCKRTSDDASKSNSDDIKTGISRLFREQHGRGPTYWAWYYGHLRHPTRPGLPLASCQLILPRSPLGLPVLRLVLCVHAIAITPAGWVELVRSSISIDCGLPCARVRSVPAIVFSRPRSAFTHVMARTLAESPSDPLHRKFRQLRCLRCRFDC